MGEADGGEPGKLYYFNDPTGATELFGRTSPLGRGIDFAFQGGVKGGASLVIGVRVDPAGKATGIIDDGTTALDVESDDFGVYTNSYSLSIQQGSVTGTMAVVEGKFVNGQDYYKKIDNETDFTQLVDKINDQTALTVTVTAGGSPASASLDIEYIGSTSAPPYTVPETTFRLYVDGKLVQYSVPSGGQDLQTVASDIVNVFNNSALADRFTASTSFSDPIATITIEANKNKDEENSVPVSLETSTTLSDYSLPSDTTTSGGTDPVAPTGESVDLSGGFNSQPILQDWLDVLDSIKYVPLRYIVPVGTSDIGVQAAVSDHVTLMSSTENRRERVCVLGHGLGWPEDDGTQDSIKGRSEFFNSYRVIFCSPGYKTADPGTGLPKTFASHQITAPVVAGMLAAEGNGVTDPITHTFLRNVISMEYEYQPNSPRTDKLIRAGTLLVGPEPASVVPSRGYYVMRALNTYRVQAGSLSSPSVVNQSDFVAQTVRLMEERLFIGRPILPKTLDLLREKVNKTLTELAEDQYIYGFDASFTKVQINDDLQEAVDVTYKI
ncbi:MAG: hypothetical protein ABEI54_00555, partial [Candidatus Bipolaricaulia bacterium]